MPCRRECQKSNNLTRHLNINFARDEVFLYISLLSMHDHHEKMAFSHYSRAVMAKKCTKSVMHMQSCCFVDLNLLLFCRSR